jgi:hypothetical protein
MPSSAHKGDIFGGAMAIHGHDRVTARVAGHPIVKDVLEAIDF